uniref:T9SS type A sorting domain-containing protein n=1 Tax=Flavobacterium sp. TaxID=239 RepID=UPI00404B2FE2
MKTTLFFSKAKTYKFYNALALTLFVNLGFGQQVIGQFPTMDGGLEGQTATTTLSSIGSTGTPSETNWSVSSTGNSEVRTISDDPANARTGNFSSSLSLKTTANNARMQAPTPVSPAFQVETEYTVQYFYKTNTDPGTYLSAGIYLNSTSGGVTPAITNETPFESNTWTKGYATFTSGASFNILNWAVARISTSPDSNVYNDIISFDDFVVYGGAYDNVAPEPVSAGTYTVNDGTTTIAWTPAATADDATIGIVNGGYVLVRYDSMPADDNDLNQNGIYKVGNTTTNGTDNLTGTVVYIGADTSFTEAYVANTYYKIYAVDKAFNYSDEVTVIDPVLSVADLEISNISIYPNPVKNTLFINANESVIDSVMIYTLDGKKVLQLNQMVENSIDVSGLSNGVYFVRLVTATNKTLTRKIVVQ